jgi:hypothetical protein
MNGIIGSITTLVSALLGFWAAFLTEKKRQKQSRIDEIFEKRMKVYGEGLEFIYEVEASRTKPEEIERIIERWKKWYPSNAIYLPPSVNDALFGAMQWTLPVIIDLQYSERDGETIRAFEENLQQAKTQLMNLKDIGWLPKDLK